MLAIPVRQRLLVAGLQEHAADTEDLLHETLLCGDGFPSMNSRLQARSADLDPSASSSPAAAAETSYPDGSPGSFPGLAAPVRPPVRPCWGWRRYDSGRRHRLRSLPGLLPDDAFQEPPL